MSGPLQKGAVGRQLRAAKKWLQQGEDAGDAFKEEKQI